MSLSLYDHMDFFDDCLIPMMMLPRNRRCHSKKSRSFPRDAFSLLAADDVFPKFGGVGHVDMQECGDSYQLTVDLPGMKKEDIRMLVDDHQLVIEGKREHEVTKCDEKEGEAYCYTEKQYGTFHRSFTLPQNADVDQLTGSYENGVLSIDVPKIPKENTARMITIN